MKKIGLAFLIVFIITALMAGSAQARPGITGGGDLEFFGEGLSWWGRYSILTGVIHRRPWLSSSLRYMCSLSKRRLISGITAIIQKDITLTSRDFHPDG